MQTRLKQVRLAAGLSQQELAYRSGLSLATISKVERGADTTIKTALKIAQALDVSISDLLEEAS